jgi:chromosome segregation ATPase
MAIYCAALQFALVDSDTAPHEDKPLHERVVSQGEEALGKLAQEVLESSIVSSALSAAFETRERAMRAQEVAMAALNLPSASDLERLTRRIRNVSQRLEGIEDGLDRLEQRLDGLAQQADSERAMPGLEARFRTLEAALERLETALAADRPTS